MKKLFIFFSSLLALLLVLATVPFMAKADDVYYKIRIFTGEQGTINGQTIQETTVKYGETFTFDINSVDVSGSVDEAGELKYRAIGIYQSGIEAPHLLSFTVTEDQDFVVVYGMAGELVPYTVHYMAGTTELGSDTYYAYDGEKAIAAAKYFENYAPTYRNITGTVRKNQTNDWQLPYVEMAAPAAAGGAGAGAPGGIGAGAGAAGGAGGAEVQAPLDLLDIDDNATPFAGPGDNQTTGTIAGTNTPTTNKPEGGSSIWKTVGIVGGIVVVAAAIVAIILGTRKRRRS